MLYPYIARLQEVFVFWVQSNDYLVRIRTTGCIVVVLLKTQEEMQLPLSQRAQSCGILLMTGWLYSHFKSYFCIVWIISIIGFALSVLPYAEYIFQRAMQIAGGWNARQDVPLSFVIGKYHVQAKCPVAWIFLPPIHAFAILEKVAYNSPDN